MHFTRLFRSKAKGGISRKISGITTSDWITLYNTIKREYENTAEKHKKPTEYMRGLAFALKVLDDIKPYTIAEVQ